MTSASVVCIAPPCILNTTLVSIYGLAQGDWKAGRRAPVDPSATPVATKGDPRHLAVMPAYRFYTLPRGHGDSPIEQAFYADRVAMSWAFRRAEAAGIEIWEGSRFVGRLHGGLTARGVHDPVDALSGAPEPRTADMSADVSPGAAGASGDD
jgi:hypothetical protein